MGQTGIKANQELNDFFAKCKEDNSRSKYRMIKVVISNEELSLDMSKETSGDWKQDWDKMVLRSIETDEPCYLFYRLDEKMAKLIAGYSSVGPLILQVFAAKCFT